MLAGLARHPHVVPGWATRARGGAGLRVVAWAHAPATAAAIGSKLLTTDVLPTYMPLSAPSPPTPGCSKVVSLLSRLDARYTTKVVAPLGVRWAELMSVVMGRPSGSFNAEVGICGWVGGWGHQTTGGSQQPGAGRSLAGDDS
jgi:hypothetical protein